MQKLLALSLVILLAAAETSHAKYRNGGRGGRGGRGAKAIFIFGDSLVDSGNNNYLNSLAKANFAPNGEDWPNHLGTGRFCNGRLVADYISEYMGTEPVLPILDPKNTGRNLLRGANFASAGSGILDDTGAMFVQRLRVSEQYNLFRRYKGQLATFVGGRAADRIVAAGLYSFTIGGNDYINNYLQALSARARQYTPPQYNTLLVSTFKQQLKDLYNMGARKISVGNMGPIGCIPSQITQRGVNGQCVQNLNEYARDYNSKLKPMLDELNRELRGALFVYVNAYDILSDLVSNPGKNGFTVSNSACCGQGNYNGLFICTAFSTICNDRTKYVFWDPYHPTEKANILIAQQTLFGGTNVISPMNLRQLLALP
ncbi:GDSL esterase/lipase At4g28780 [Selaginella moellendorffii]|uniref:GDSL esterase/lipase At4g28780 n=1 Tax=Selaginella moellendorffii TaxID=88036 RepID=UPI000D1C29FF|nr:GDSL esterase/lipase At4g28780 [Selaginella moellendorffii]|eukprot:XP_024518500.1 GDSL esterase/lipase At4g28780 [Selaginella moellendorffii]